MTNSKFILTVDTEWDRKEGESDVTVSNIEALQELHDICSAFNIKPNYMCSYEVITSSIFEKFLARNDPMGFEVGAHLHPWTNPPLIDIDDSAKKPYPTEYSSEMFVQKLHNLTVAFKERGLSPISYRAGRFGFDQRIHTPLLIDQGYLIDCSVTPGVDWSNALGYSKGGPDFRGFKHEPYFIDREGKDFEKYASNALLEVPVTVFNDKGRDVWLRPLMHKKKIGFFRYETFDLSLLKQLSLQQIKQPNLNVLHMFMHSNEMDATTNPYFDTKEKIAHLKKCLNGYFLFLKENNVASISLQELYKLKSKGEGA